MDVATIHSVCVCVYVFLRPNPRPPKKNFMRRQTNAFLPRRVLPTAFGGTFGLVLPGARHVGGQPGAVRAGAGASEGGLETVEINRDLGQKAALS